MRGRHLFLPEEEHETHTIAHVEEYAKEAEGSGEPVYGVKGMSMLSPYIDTTKSAAVDCMHAALEGVTKTLLATCLDSKYYADHFTWDLLQPQRK